MILLRIKIQNNIIPDMTSRSRRAELRPSHGNPSMIPLREGSSTTQPEAFE
jgi:hypothetical protein